MHYFLILSYKVQLNVTFYVNTKDSVFIEERETENIGTYFTHPGKYPWV